MLNHQTNRIACLITALLATLAHADDSAVNKKLLKTPALGNSQVQSVAQPVPVAPTNAGGDTGLNPQPFTPAEAAQLPSTAVKPNLPANALPSVQPVQGGLPATNKLPMASPMVGGLGFKLNAQNLQQLQTLPDAQSITLPDGTQTSAGEAKRKLAQAKQNFERMQNTSPSLGAGNPISVKNAALKSIDARAILQSENAAADSAYVHVQGSSVADNLLKESKSKMTNIDNMPAACAPCITRVNGKDISKVSFTPGVDGIAAKITISGDGFGEQKPQVYLTGPFQNRPPELRVDEWGNRQIVAYFSQGYQGEIDHDGVGLAVTTASGKQLKTAASGKFVATRAEYEIAFDNIPQASIHKDTEGLQGYPGNNGYHLYANLQNRKASLEKSFSDYIQLDFLKVGFEVNSAFATLYDNTVESCNDCKITTLTFGENALNLQDGRLIIRRKSISHLFIPLGLGSLIYPDRVSYNVVYNNLKIKVIGPAGVNPIK